jgi:hypothetical protein
VDDQVIVDINLTGFCTGFAVGALLPGGTISGGFAGTAAILVYAANEWQRAATVVAAACFRGQ